MLATSFEVAIIPTLSAVRKGGVYRTLTTNRMRQLALAIASWQCVTNADPNSNPDPQPSRAIRLEDGNTIISDQYNNRVFIVDHATPCNTLTVYGLPLNNGLNTGFGSQNANQGMNGPYDAKVIGDFTGLTPPDVFDPQSSEEPRTDNALRIRRP